MLVRRLEEAVETLQMTHEEAMARQEEQQTDVAQLEYQLNDAKASRDFDEIQTRSSDRRADHVARVAPR